MAFFLMASLSSMGQASRMASRNASMSSSGGPGYHVGTNVASVGIGLGSSLAGYTYGSQTPAISLQYERGLWNAGPGVISLGAYLGFKGYSYNYNDFGYPYSEKWNYTIVGIRGAYHFTGIKTKNFDLYAGIMLADNILKYSFTYNGGPGTAPGSYGSSTGFSLFVGGRFYFTNNIGAFAELGYGISYLTLGVCLKF